MIGTLINALSSLRQWSGSVIDDRVLELVDTDHNRTISTTELQQGISTAITAIAANDIRYDLNGDSMLGNADLSKFLQSISIIMGSVCSNGTVEAVEQCDDYKAKPI